MTNYTKTTNFATKDTLPSGNANKIVKGTEIDTEFNNIATAVATKADTAGPTFTGTVTIPTVDLNGGAIDGTTVGASTAAAITGTTIVANTSINIAGDGATVTGIKDEDDMSSNSATKLATQQSIKAYVDSQVTAQDLDFQADSGGALSIDLDSETLTFTGGTGVDTSGSGNAVTFAIDSTVATLAGTQTLTNKTLTSPTLNTPTIGTSFTIGSATITEAELEILDGATVTTAELNVLDGITSTTAELNILDGVTSTAAELNILDGVTSTAAELNILDGVTATTAELNIMDGVTATTAELNFVDGVTSAIQTQLDAKAPTANPTFTGSFTSPGIDDNATSTAMTLDSSGNVGIGTSSPSALLDVEAASPVIELTATTTTATTLGAKNNRILLTSNSTTAGAGGEIVFNTSDANTGRWGAISGHITENASGAARGDIVFATKATSAATSLTERMRIDSSGNLLVGRTLAGSGTGFEANTAFGSYILSTSTAIAGVFDRLSTDGDIVQFRKDGSPVGSIGSIASNYLSIGTGDTGLLFQDDNDFIEPCNVGTSAGRDAAIDLGHSGGRFKDLHLSGGAYIGGVYNTGIYNQQSGDIQFWVPNVGEAVRIQQNTGNLLVGKTSQVSAGRFGVQYDSGQHGVGIDQDFSGGGTFINFLVQNSPVGSVQTNGSTTSYNTSSDYRLKENIVDAPSASDDIDAIQVRSFDWKADGSHQKYGMVAQELQAVAPEAVSIPDDPEEMAGVDYSKLVPMLVKEIQSLRARVQQLENN
jgi:hypothetical protein